MVNTKFEAYKLKRELKRSGIEYEFFRRKNNEFGEPGSETESVGSILGLYHEQNSNIQIATGEAIQTRTKKIPMILCLHEDATSLNFSVGDYTVINGKKYKLTGIVNILEWNIISDISLEVFDDGNEN